MGRPLLHAAVAVVLAAVSAAASPVATNHPPDSPDSSTVVAALPSLPSLLTPPSTTALPRRRTRVAARDVDIDYDAPALEYMPLRRVDEDAVPPALRRRTRRRRAVRTRPPWTPDREMDGSDELTSRALTQDASPADTEATNTTAHGYPPPPPPYGFGHDHDHDHDHSHNHGHDGNPTHTWSPPPPRRPDGGHSDGLADTADVARVTNVRDIYYLVNITVGGQSLLVNLDTGSSDTWVVGHDYECVGRSGGSMGSASSALGGTAACDFGPSFAGAVAPLAPPQAFRRFFDDGTFVSGAFGRADVALGGLTAHNQQIGVVNRTHWFGGDGRSSGLLGLAYPYLTGADGHTHAYDPVFTTLCKQNATAPVFTLALSREDEDTGQDRRQPPSYVAFGGVPPAVPYDAASWARAPIEPVAALRGGWHYAPGDCRGLYVVTPTAYVHSRRADDGSAEVVTTAVGGQETAHDSASSFSLPAPTAAAAAAVSVDAGSTLTVLPADVAGAVLGAFDPPPHWDPVGGAYYAPCTARVPTFGVQMGDADDGTHHVFYMAAADLLRQGERDHATGRFCRVGIVDGAAPPYVLGVTFLTNVVAVFDIGRGEMRFAQRTPY